MRIQDAPAAGWYPDPEGGSRLRWWEGTDWADRWRAPPTRGELDRRTLVAAQDAEDHASGLGHYQDAAQRAAEVVAGNDPRAWVNEMRQAARTEAERATQQFTDQARSAAQELQPLISEYTSKITRWFRILAVLVIVGLIVYVAVQIFAQASLLDWIGDRIDNLGDDAGVITARAG